MRSAAGGLLARYSGSIRALELPVRAVLVVLCAVLAAVHGPTRSLAWLVALCGIAALSSRLPEGNLRLVGCCFEAGVAALAVLATVRMESPLFPYLPAAILAGGLAGGVVGTLVPTGVSATILMVGGLAGVAPDATDFSTASAQWIVLSLVLGLTGAGARRLSLTAPASAPADPAYADAHRLLSQLRPVARQLPVGLDPSTVGRALLDNLGAAARFDRGVVAARSGGGRLVVLAYQGGQRPDWELTVEEEDSPFVEAWVSQQAQSLPRRLDGRTGHAVVLPMVVGVRTSGIVALERDEPWPADEVRGSAELVNAAGLQLEAALLFDEVREIATAEERRRMAREIHDGIAQELSYVGYVLDGLAAQGKREKNPLEAPIRELRAEVTRLVSDLRLSMFELKSDVDAHASLGAALSEHVQSVVKSSGAAVHVSLKEGAARLPAEAEAELLRIAQEFLADVRKNPQAENIWVALEVDAPVATLVVEHDGADRRGRRRDDQQTIEAIKQRVERLRAQMELAPREGGGERLVVRLGATP